MEDLGGTLRTANASMVARWQRIPARHRELASPLAAVAQSALVRVSDALVFEQLLNASTQTLASEDPTGFEAAVNKIHLADYFAASVVEDLLVQGVLFAEKLTARLSQMNRPCRVILSLDPDSNEVAVRFFVKREGQLWGAEEVNAYQAAGLPGKIGGK